ncbi:hypothetical protein PPACK8108_LOCUS4412 [Phakopsora pachyrhizi]|uniref:Uncharacterized protein n=1 Tax=Phakopsora pachyrhizi TaxID=170000 RepID=A0AAV0ANQ8_PHAPC|nr:hypothetical protein PPACK8108_LOCUS4412 [Phakopsora pachyrhizi]
MRSVQLFGTSKDLQHNVNVDSEGIEGLERFLKEEEGLKEEDDNEEEEDLEEDVDDNVEEVYEKEFDGPGKFPSLFLEYKLVDGVMLVLVLMLVALPSLVVLLLVGYKFTPIPFCVEN